MEWESSSTLPPLPFLLEKELLGLHRVPSSFSHGLCLTLLFVHEAPSDSVLLDHNYSINSLAFCVLDSHTDYPGPVA